MLAAASTVCVGIGDGRAACFTAAVLAQSQAFPVQIRLDALEFYGTFIDVPKEVAMPPQANFRFDDELRLDVTPGTGDHVFLMPAARSTGHMTMRKPWMKTS